MAEGVQKMMTLQPALARFKELAKAANLIAVTAELSMDLDTPVSVYCKLVGEAEGFILESVDTTHQQFGRYSFIGAEPFIRLQVFKNRLMIREDDLMKCLDGTPQETLKKYMEGFRPAVEDEELPLANGGMVGYLNYEIAATFDRVRTVTLGEDELLGQFMVCRHLVVFDALKNTARLIHLARGGCRVRRGGAEDGNDRRTAARARRACRQNGCEAKGAARLPREV